MTRTTSPAPSPAAFIDATDFARTGGHLAAEDPVARLPRLASSLFDDAGTLVWSLTGRRSPRPEGGQDDELVLTLSGRVGVPCTRCLGRVDIPIGAARTFLLARDEATAERLDEEEEDRDVLATSRRFDVRALVEDEAIMQLPIAAAHDQCDLPASLDAEPDPDPALDRPNPFAVLAALKKR